MGVGEGRRALTCRSNRMTVFGEVEFERKTRTSIHQRHLGERGTQQFETEAGLCVEQRKEISSSCGRTGEMGTVGGQRKSHKGKWRGPGL